MHIWVDADACPAEVKDLVFRASRRLSLPVKLVSNRAMYVPPTALVTLVRVAKELDAADHYIVQHVAPNDLVITADIPLAASVIDKQAVALNPRGELYTQDNIRERLSMRNFMDGLRSGGMNTGGPAPLTNQDKQAFANRLDAWLAKQPRSTLT